MIDNNLVALIITFLISLIWLRANDYLAHKGWMSSRLSRKIIHTGTGPIFVVCWLLFPNDQLSRYLAALVPLAFTMQFLLIGLGIIKDEASVKAMSRSGDRREILKGPLYYGIVFVLMTILFWFDSPVGIIALMLLCGGDGLAEILGRRLGKHKIPWSKNKTFLGSIGMLIGGWFFAVLIIGIYIYAGIFTPPLRIYIPGITIIAFIAMVVESLPIPDFDNITITLTGVILGLILF
jgi:phytol kinase